MIVLAVSTSLSKASCALFDSELNISKEKQCADKKTYSETLMPTLSALLDECNITPDKIDLIAVDIGPGSFTGVRIGVASSNALACALSKEMIAVSSLEALAYPFIFDNAQVVSLLDARNGNGYGAVYQNSKEAVPPSAIVINCFLESIDSSLDTLFVGDGARIHKNLILEKMPSARFCEDEQISTSLLARYAFEKYKNGEATNEVLPLYLRPSQAERLYGKS